MKNTYIINKHGFFIKKEYNKETKKMDYFYSDTVRNATCFTSKTAKKLSESINGFCWQPYKEEPIKDSYEVIKAQEYSFTEIKGYKITKQMMAWNSDAKFLYNRKLEPTMTKDEALKQANAMNWKRIKETYEIIKKNEICIEKTT